MDRQTVLVSALASLLFLTCRTGSGILPQKGPTGGLSQTSSITIAAPNRDQLKPEQKEKLNGFRLSIEPVDAACLNASKINSVGSLSQPTLGTSIVQGCDYLLVLEFGKLAANSTTLEKVYFTNVSVASKGLTLKKEDTLNKPDVSVSITLKITEAGIADGFGKNGEIDIVPPSAGGSGSVIINATIEGSGGSTPPPVPSGTPSGGSTAVVFGDFRDRAAASCGGGSCHAPANTEEWWKANASTIRARLNSVDPAVSMPKTGSPQQGRFSLELKKIMLDFVK